VPTGKLNLDLNRVTFVQRSAWHQSQFACETHAAQSGWSTYRSALPKAVVGLLGEQTEGPGRHNHAAGKWQGVLRI